MPHTVQMTQIMRNRFRTEVWYDALTQGFQESDLHMPLLPQCHLDILGSQLRLIHGHAAPSGAEGDVARNVASLDDVARYRAADCVGHSTAGCPSLNGRPLGAQLFAEPRV